MKKAITSQEEILAVCKEIAARQGLEALNMRSVAQACGVALGSVYNYFPSKNDLMIAAVESIWQDIFLGVTRCQPSDGFAENVEHLFYAVKSGGQRYPLFFDIHALGIAKSGKDKGRQTMNQYFSRMKADLLSSLETDSRVKQDFFSEKCSRVDFVDFVFSNLLSLLMQNRSTCDVLLEIIKGAIY